MPKTVVLGGYGLIGGACMAALAEAGFHTVGIGRSRRAAMAANPDADWLIHDIPSLSPADWRDILRDADVVVNASGALQDGARDDLNAIHVTAVQRLVEGIADLPTRIVHISAAGVSPNASTDFFRSKARGDEIVASAANDWVILRPTLVLSCDAYGGTALLRALAASPIIMPRVMPDTPVQTVFVDDVAAAVCAAAQGTIASQTIADLTEPTARPFHALTMGVRRWQGYAAPRFAPNLPRPVIRTVGLVADFLGRLGWRSPLRSTALAALRDGIQGDPTAWIEAGGAPCRSFEQTLRQIPATRQERLFARAYLALPIAIGTLAVFWFLSGLITLLNVPDAVSVLTARSVSPAFSALLVVGGAFADILLGLAILWRPLTKLAALGMIALSGAYLIASIFVAPGLWADPLGPMVKVFPGITLAGLVWLLMEDR